ncbi:MULTISPECIES: cell division protein FtsQ/DivIB [Lactobacillus]|uniref:Cell division protein DivIB n=2 Tax=Lactobacillus gallinarum TaxID=52242 RepID=A0A1Y4W5F7_9LACO|nr:MULTISPECIES: FtsQ-type POTRA domain-containing protein [Lactobacillus]KRL24724.1 cell division protein [Lactobacillus gallinarum DSM 10532 = JCM 2011]MBL1060586.1 FtsQ-type POTRA domain-containing protein [Lactobacillus sp. A27]MBM6958263.1 FtsQ-type POTRA domain-containing protein [Lactobacillus gallinarum]MCC9271721.1 FtsQ-type POTRA domain-containing protein [Lactobacillus gallinarum]MDM8276471.1 FtsQ-type POTRA domain-containing protein [Lactobacillus gallinarum]
MAKKPVTRIDPRKELSPYLNHEFNQQKNSRKSQAKISASLSSLQAERRRSLRRRLGLIMSVSVLAIAGLGYYISPLANISTVKVIGASDLPIKGIVKASKIKASDKVFDYLFQQKDLSQKLSKKYPEIESAQAHLGHVNQLILQINERKTVGYLKDGDDYRKILSNGKLGSTAITWAKVDQDKPIFVGYNKATSLKEDLNLFNSLPKSFQNQVKLLSGNTRRKSQVILVMKDGNVIIGSTVTLKSKLKYYDEIKVKAGKNSLIDLEIGAFSRPLTSSEKKAYGVS